MSSTEIAVLINFPRSGTEEEFAELQQLCEDIITYGRDVVEERKREKEAKKKKEEEDKKEGEEMRKAAVERLARYRIYSLIRRTWL